MEALYDQGVNFFDNAEVYGDGECERVMGEAIRTSTKWHRSDLVVSTKLFWGPRRHNHTNHEGLSRKHILQGMQASLARLQLAYVDIVFAHRPDPDTPMEETVRAFNHVINQGQAFYWGTSEWSCEQIEEARTIAQRLHLVGPLAEQPEYSILHRKRVEEEYAPLYAKEAGGLGLTTWSSLAFGLLTGKYSNGIPVGSRLDKVERLRKVVVDEGKYGSFEDVLRKINSLETIAHELDCSLPQLSLAWAASNPRVSTVILGGTKLEQLQENLGALRVLPFITPEIKTRIHQVFIDPTKQTDTGKKAEL